MNIDSFTKSVGGREVTIKEVLNFKESLEGSMEFNMFSDSIGGGIVRTAESVFKCIEKSGRNLDPRYIKITDDRNGGEVVKVFEITTG